MTQRELKFRVWDHFDNKMVDIEDVDASLYFPSFQGTFVIGRYTNTGDWIDDLPIMFYTGLKDKHGKDIYGGDVVRFLDENYQVIYFEQYASFMLLHSNGNDLQNITTQEEVIGNIYENPELL